MTHAIERTSPKGKLFRGYCIKCGKRGLTSADALKPCPADDIVSDTNAMIQLIKDEPQ